ncbi:MAG: DUF371 domain-containing protein [Candidatus Methanomethyliaceae archaeon]|nr:DUF371 domain-containing protein [Candidatus Methanomethyliaceae archaeon]
MFKIVFYAWGDPLISALHRTTMEITKHDIKSPKGDCIIATRSELALKDLPEEFKERAKDEKARIGLIIEAGGISEEVWGKGHPKLSFESEHDMIIRKTNFICKRTLMIGANKAAIELNRLLVEVLKNKNTKARFTLIVE